MPSVLLTLIALLFLTLVLLILTAEDEEDGPQTDRPRTGSPGGDGRGTPKERTLNGEDGDRRTGFRE